ncbi:MAG: ATP-binding cassette domain-containing protein, partial [Hyphomicrobiales bacterium]
MTLITLKDVDVTLGINLFSGLNFTLNKGDQLGLVAANGCGKSTLLKCIAGVSEITEGDITRSRGLRPGLVEQEVPNDLLGLTLYQSILHALPPEQAETESWRVDIVLDDLKVPEEVRSKELGRLSGGWRRVALLGAAWIIEPDVLLLDEPTNHLDLSRIGVLQSWLLSVGRGVPFIVASHDRAFLDAITHRTLFLREKNSCNFALPY